MTGSRMDGVIITTERGERLVAGVIGIVARLQVFLQRAGGQFGDVHLLGAQMAAEWKFPGRRIHALSASRVRRMSVWASGTL
jgi:hypothetical protein